MVKAKHFHRELENIKKKILELGAVVEERVHLAVKAVDDFDITIAQKILETDHEINAIEVDIEEDCLKVIALYQPVAVDLRFLTAIIKINNDLERIADLAVNIAQRVKVMAKYTSIGICFDYGLMGQKAQKMLTQSLDSLVQMDSRKAIQVCELDDEVDDLKNEAYEQVKASIKADPSNAPTLLNQFLLSRHLERIADHATNIAEDVVYMIEGEIVRHNL